MRLFALAILFAFSVGCAPGARTLVYAFDDGVPQGRLDRELCITGAGLRLDLGPTESIAFDISSDQRSARLATCDLEGSTVLSCGVLVPEIPLELEGNAVTGVGTVSAGFENTDCSGADLTSTWTMLLDESETRLTGAVELLWTLHDTPECVDFEAEVLASFTGNGRINGCIVDYDFTATQVADCGVDGNTLLCN